MISSFAEIYQGEEPDLDLETVDYGLANRCYKDFWEYRPFSDVLSRLDHDLFPAMSSGPYYRGWRNGDNYVGLYLSPARRNVPYLMESFAEKVEKVSRDLSVSSEEEWYKLVAWAAWTQRDIRPKQDGNGRLIKACMGVMVPRRRFYGYVSPLWNRASDVQALCRMQDISDRFAAEIPGYFTDFYSKGATDQSTKPTQGMINDMMVNFYRPGEGTSDMVDRTAFSIFAGIDNTRVAHGKLYPEGVDARAIRLMVDFIKEAPLRQQPKIPAWKKIWPAIVS